MSRMGWTPRMHPGAQLLAVSGRVGRPFGSRPSAMHSLSAAVAAAGGSSTRRHFLRQPGWIWTRMRSSGACQLSPKDSQHISSHASEVLEELYAALVQQKQKLAGLGRDNIRESASTFLAVLLSFSLAVSSVPAFASVPRRGAIGPSDGYMVPPAESARLINQADLASVGEDALLEFVKQVEAAFSSGYSDVSDAIPGLPSEDSEVAAKESELAQELVKEVWEVVDQNYLDARGTGFDKKKWEALRDEALARPLRNRGAAHRAIKNMLARGLSDPYTRFIDSQEFDSMKKYDVTGVGLNLGSNSEFQRKLNKDLPRGRSSDEEGIWVLGLIKDSQADAIGIEQGDEILSVNGEAVGQRSPFQISSTIHGGPDSPSQVQVTVAKQNTGQTETFTVQRPKNTIVSPVTTELKKEGKRSVGYIHLSSFNALAQQEVSNAIKNLEGRGAGELVLDLRDNRGGLVTSGVEIARLFLDGPDSTVVVTKGAPTRPDDRIVATGPPLTRAPLTVLVNEHTASASEILAGSLKDNCRAVLVGNQTYGKGLIQSVYELSDSSGLVITVGRYVTPAGTNIDRDGIKPDFSKRPSPEAREQALGVCMRR